MRLKNVAIPIIAAERAIDFSLGFGVGESDKFRIL